MKITQRKLFDYNSVDGAERSQKDIEGTQSKGSRKLDHDQAHMKQGIPLASGMEIAEMLQRVDPERTASKFDGVYYRGLLEKAWGEVVFVFRIN